MRITLFLKLLLTILLSGYSLTGTLTQSSNSIGKYNVLELAFHHSGTYANPWEDLDLKANLISPSGDTFQIGGFYYNTDEWRFRFAPTREGVWKWNARITYRSDVFADSGQFTCFAGTNQGFLKVHPDNPCRLAYADNTPFYPAGLQSCIGINLNWCYGSTCNLDVHNYIKIFADAGFNIWRFSLDNCALRVEDTVGVTGNRYRIRESAAYDSLMRTAHELGMRIILNPCLDNIIWVDQYSDSAQMAAVKRQIQYHINRWAAYADIIEIANEPYSLDALPLEWLNIVVPYIRASDPYGHLVGQDLVQRLLTDSSYVKLFDIMLPHLYFDGSDNSQDAMISGFFKAKHNTIKNIKSMPVIMGEQGNSSAGQEHATSARQQRIRYWSAFFSQGGLVSWHQNYNK